MKRMQEKDTNGITLIALVITIVVLIILAGVVITLSLGNNGIFNRAKQAKEEYEIAAEKEKLGLEITNIQTAVIENKNEKATLKDLYEKIDKTKYEIELDDEENPTLAYVKPVKGNYTFSVDSKFKIENSEKQEEKTKEINFDFKNNKNDFEDVQGSCIVDENGIKPNNFTSSSSDAWNRAIVESKKDVSLNLYSKFEISADILFENNDTNYKMGGIQIFLNNGENTVSTISLVDAWESNQWVQTYIETSESTQIYNSKESKVQASGEYKIVSDGTKIKALLNDTVLGEIDYIPITKIDSIKISFLQYPSHGTPTTALKNLNIKTEP